MSNLSSSAIHCLRGLGLLGLLLAALVGCGGPEPTPQVIVVTSTFTPAPAVQVVTATFTPQPLVVTATPTPVSEPLPTEPPPPAELPPTEAPEPTATLIPALPPLEFFTYQHPSGVFSLDIPVDSDYSEEDEGLALVYGDSIIMLFFTSLDEPITTEELESLVYVVMDDVLVAEDLVISYSDLDVQGSESGNSYVANFAAVSEDFGEGEGTVIVWYVDQTVYFVVLLTPDFAAVEEVWNRAIDSLEVNPPQPQAPAAPTPVPPTNTPKPKPKPTNTSQPPPQANKGCYLFENQLGAEVTLTFTARDWQWSDTFKVPAGQSKEYCFDPGRYTYTLDAPPPWGSTNGELEVQAGDRYRFPIRAG
jgi:hypothetical protein